MAQPEMRTFADFWPLYVREHSNETNRMLHVVGTTLSMGSLAAGLITRRRGFFLAAPVLGYGFAWVGHFLVEGNRPATFKHPLWSLRGDFVMWWKMVTGAMDAEIAAANDAADGAANGVQSVHAERAANEVTPISREAN